MLIYALLFFCDKGFILWLVAVKRLYKISDIRFLILIISFFFFSLRFRSLLFKSKVHELVELNIGIAQKTSTLLQHITFVYMIFGFTLIN